MIQFRQTDMFVMALMINRYKVSKINKENYDLIF